MTKYHSRNIANWSADDSRRWRGIVNNVIIGISKFLNQHTTYIDTSSTRMKIKASVIKESYLVNSLIHLYLMSPHLHASDSSPYYCSIHRSIARSPTFLWANERTHSSSCPWRPSQVKSSPAQTPWPEPPQSSIHPSIHPLIRRNPSLCTLNPLSASAFIYAWTQAERKKKVPKKIVAVDEDGESWDAAAPSKKKKFETHAIIHNVQPLLKGQKATTTKRHFPHHACLYKEEEKLCAGICCRKRRWQENLLF